MLQTRTRFPQTSLLTLWSGRVRRSTIVVDGAMERKRNGSGAPDNRVQRDHAGDSGLLHWAHDDHSDKIMRKTMAHFTAPIMNETNKIMRKTEAHFTVPKTNESNEIMWKTEAHYTVPKKNESMRSCGRRWPTSPRS